MATMTAPVTDTKRIPGGSFLITDPTAADCFFPEDFTDEHKQIAETTAALYMRKSATRGGRATWPPRAHPPSLYYISHYIFYILEEGQVCLRALLSGKTSK